VAYKARDRNDLLAGIDEFLDCVTVLPPGEWDPAIRIEPPKAVPSQVVTHLLWLVGSCAVNPFPFYQNSPHFLQAECRRRLLNLALVFCVDCMLYVLYSYDACLFLWYLM